MTDTIFMIHGMWGGGWYWEKYKDFFERKGYRCVTPTLPYHDIDPKDQPDPRLGTTSLLDYADCLEKEILDLGVKPIIMGHSMGGLLAQMLASRGLGKSVVLLAPASPRGINAITPSVFKAFLSIQLRWAFWKKPTRQTFKEAAESMLQLFPESEQRRLYDKFVYESGRAAFEIGYWWLDRKCAAKVDAAKLTYPMLVISGAKDRITPESVVRRVAKKYKNATYKIFHDHAHWVISEPGWEDVADYTSRWLDSARKRTTPKLTVISSSPKRAARG